jgi:hypothetical protein
MKSSNVCIRSSVEMACDSCLDGCKTVAFAVGAILRELAIARHFHQVAVCHEK